MKSEKTIGSFSTGIKNKLHEILGSSSYSGMIEAKDVKELIVMSGLSEEKFLLELLKVARDFALPKISNFNVGAISSGISGNIYFGANQEFPGTSLNFTLHAEQASLSNAALHGELGIKSVTVTYIPCCLCRQFMLELDNAMDLKIILPDKTLTLKDLVPYPFGPSDLGITARFMREIDNGLMKNVTCPSDKAVACEARKAANKSYSPYSNSFSGVALQVKDGRIMTGRYIENAAYNISMNPMTAVVSSLNMHGLEYHDICKAVIVEPKKNTVSQIETAKTLLKAVNNAIELEIVKID
ncbi:MAG: cytidine deaminase [Lentisphaerota bacterium]